MSSLTNYQEQLELGEESGTPEYQQNPGFQTLQAAHDDLTRWQLDLDEVINELELSLKGMVFDPSRKRWVQRYKPRANEEGISSVMTEVRSRLNKNFILTNLEDSDIKRIMIEINTAIINKIILCRKEMGIDKTDIESIVDMIDHAVFATLKRAEKGHTLHAISTITRRYEQVSTQQRDQNQDNGGGRRSGSFLSLFTPGG